jgi:AcrR family transcriptional regulator
LRGDRRRAVILEAARHLFAQRGYHGASVGDIARGSGCSEPILYRHFASKQALFAAVLEHGAADLLAALDGAIEARPDDPLAALGEYVDRTITDPRTAELVRIRSLAVALADEPEILDALRRSMTAYLDALTRAAAASQRSGTVSADLNPRHLAELWAGLGFLAGFLQVVGGETAIRELSPAVGTLLRLAMGSRDGPPP